MEQASKPVSGETSCGASAGLRAAGAPVLRDVLLLARARTLEWAKVFAAGVGTKHPAVPYSPDLNPPLWELGHVAWFQEFWTARNRQWQRGIACEPDHERSPPWLAQADEWFNSSRVAHRTRWELPLPDAGAIRDYLDSALERTLAMLDALPESAGEDDLYFFRLVAAHEAMHAEAAAYMAVHLGIGDAPAVRLTATEHELALPAQAVRIGSPRGAFAFDNELQAHEVKLAPFCIDAAPVTWDRFLPFIEAGGYQRREFWSDAGWQDLARRAAPLPRSLRKDGRGWQHGCSDRWIELDRSLPAVHVNAHEAQAWCRWAGRRLPTEAEWECAAISQPAFAWGSVWEWTATVFEPYPGFEPHPYRDYSAPWFGTRRVLRGAAAATLPFLADPHYRNFFEPHRSDIFAGFRSCAQRDNVRRVA